MAYLSSRLKNSEKQKIKTRIRLLRNVLCVGIVGFLAVVLMMNANASSVGSNSALGVSQKYAQQGGLFSLLESLLIPALILFSVIIGYALNGLLDCYSTMNSPDFYRNKSRQGGRNAKRADRRSAEQADGTIKVGRNRRTPLT